MQKWFMHIVTSMGLSLLFMHGCAWSPERDNFVDPASPYYQEPPVANRAPTIDTLFMVTDCHLDLLTRFCAFEIRAVVSDPDQNLDFRSIRADYELTSGTWVPFGLMSYDAANQWFSIRKSQDEFPGEDLDPLVGKIIRVTVVDDSAAQSARTTLFLEPLTDNVVLVEPIDQDIVNTVNPTLVWFPWDTSSVGRPQYTVGVYLQGYSLVWDTVGLADSLTSVIVTEDLISSTQQDVYYAWFLTVEDVRGNRVTSQPGYFKVIADQPQSLATISD